MAKTRTLPFTTGVKRNRGMQPRMRPTSNNSTSLVYNCIGLNLATDVGGNVYYIRYYIPGFAGGLDASAGIDVAGFYSSGKFGSGCKLRWEPSCSFGTNGRVYCGFCDNPEAVAAISASPSVASIRALGDALSFPVWQETEIPFPSRLRRKMFDVNQTVTTDPNALDRSMQTCFFIAIEADAEKAVGSMWFHDELVVEGLQVQAT